MTMVRLSTPAQVSLGLGLVVSAAAAFVLVQQPTSASSATTTVAALPAPATDESATPGTTSETAVLAGGCFWGVQSVFQHVKGVTSAESGYAGGDRQTADYELVSTGSTAHAESVRITYDPAQVTYGQLLQVFFEVVQDPTQLNRQGADVGTQYRSAIFAHDQGQRRVAESYIAQLSKAAVFAGPIVTTVSPDAEFYPAERYHQDFVNSNPTQPYVASAELPKLAALQQRFPELYRDHPALMFPGAS